MLFLTSSTTPAIAFLAIWAVVAFPALAVGQSVERVAGGSENIPSIHITANRIAISAEEVGSAYSALTREDLEKRQVRVISDVLRDVPGLAVSRSGSTGGFTQLRIRGAEADHTLVLIDGIEVNNPSGSGFDFANLVNRGTTRIEVLRGPQSALYGSDTIGGVVNVITERPSPGVRVFGLVEGGSSGTGNGVFGVSAANQEFYLSASGNRFRTEGVSVAKDGAEKDGHRNTGLHLKTGLELGHGVGIDLVGIGTDNRTENDASGPTDATGEYQTVREEHGRIGLRADLLDGLWEHRLDVARSRVKSSFFGSFSSNSTAARTKYSYQNNIRFTSPKLADGKHVLVLAVEQEKEEQSRLGSGGTAALESRSYVGELQSGFHDSLFLSVAVRRDDLAEDRFLHSADATTWRATAAWLDRKTDLRIHSSLARGLKNPTLFELAGFTASFMPNPDLRPEKSLGGDIGVEKGFRDGRVIVDLTGFYNKVEDAIQSTGTTAENTPGETRARGLEFSLRAGVTDHMTLRAAYTYTATRSPDEREAIRRPRHIASFGADARFQVAGRPAGANLAVRINGSQHDDIFLADFSRAQVKLGGYILVNLSGTFEVSDGVELFLRTENLLDKDYEEVRGYGVQGVGVYGGIRVRLGGKGG